MSKKETNGHDRTPRIEDFVAVQSRLNVPPGEHYRMKLRNLKVFLGRPGPYL